MDKDWTKGDSVIHADKPEWGSGEVLIAEQGIHEGKPCQRLTIRFTRAGMKTLSTAFANLKSAADSPRLADTPTADPLAQAAAEANIDELMLRLPERATDPFASLRQRLAATLDVYKYAESPAGLLDWAAVQTGLKDPLARFNRHELEQYFAKFRIGLDEHLRKLLRDIRKQDPQPAGDLTAASSNAARQAIRRADSLR